MSKNKKHDTMVAPAAAAQSAPQDASNPFAELMEQCKALGAKYRLVSYKQQPLALLVKAFDQKFLQFDARNLIPETLSKYAVRSANETIVPGAIQWIDGSHVDLAYRGKPVPRHKMWFQDGPTDDQVWVYGYTGWQYGIAFATFDVAQCPPLQGILQRYNDNLAASSSFPPANHGIVTQYRSGQDSIGMHFDKAHNIADQSLITIVKLGPGARPFRIETLEGDVVFQRILPPGTAVIMTKETNLASKHGVPSANGIGLSGSLVLRSITRTESMKTIRKKSAQTSARRKEAKKKRAREEGGDNRMGKKNSKAEMA